MKRLAVLAAVLLLAAGCSGDSDRMPAQMGSIAELQKSMKKADVACEGTPSRPEKGQVGTILSFGVVGPRAVDELAFGAVPAEQLKCVIDDADGTVFRYNTQTERVEAMQTAENLACDVDIKDAYWVGTGPFVLGAFDITAKDIRVTKKIGKALGLKVSRFPCGYG